MCQMIRNMTQYLSNIVSQCIRIIGYQVRESNRHTTGYGAMGVLGNSKDAKQCILLLNTLDLLMV
jgi:hypothetical protein